MRVYSHLINLLKTKNLIIMKLFIFLMVLIGYSCNSPKQLIKPFPKLSEFESFSYGDERFHDCEELVDIKFGITHDGDTLRLEETPRYNCNTYNYKTRTD
jgi:hypothetical protein